MGGKGCDEAMYPFSCQDNINEGQMWVLSIHTVTLAQFSCVNWIKMRAFEQVHLLALITQVATLQAFFNNNFDRWSFHRMQ